MHGYAGGGQNEVDVAVLLLWRFGPLMTSPAWAHVFKIVNGIDAKGR